MKEKVKPLWTYTILPGVLVLILILTYALNAGFDLNLNQFGLHPRSWNHLYGLFSFFFLHGSLEHLLNNITGIFVLSSLVRYYFPTVFLKVMLGSIIGPAILTFFIAVDGIHLGASGGVYALAVFLFLSSIIRSNRYLIGLSLLIVFLYGGLWWGIFPIEERISWEGHLSGVIIGFTMALLYRRAPINAEVKEPPPRYESEDIPDIIGDQWKTFNQIQVRYTYRDDEDSYHSGDLDDDNASNGRSAVPDDDERNRPNRES